MASRRLTLLRAYLAPIVLVHDSYGHDNRDLNEETDGGVNYPFSAPGSGGEVPVTTASGPPQLYIRIRIAHAVLGLLAFGLFFPLGSIFIRTVHLRATVWIHAGWQLFTLSMVVATMGIGIRMARDPTQADNNFFQEPHTLIGLMTICTLLALQPVTGLLQHMWFRRTGSRTTFSYGHLFLGVPLITLGAINGGLGLQLSHEPLKYTVTYGVLAGVVWVLWMSIHVVSQCLREREVLRATRKKNGSDEDGPPMRQKSGRSARH